MAFWLVQALNSQDERFFLEQSCICCLEEGLSSSILDFFSQNDLTMHLEDTYQVDFTCAKAWSNQCWSFGHTMSIGDYVALLNLDSNTIRYGRIISDYFFIEASESRYSHVRKVVWFERGVLRSALTAQGHKLFDHQEQICPLEGLDFMNTVIDAYRYAIPVAAAERLVFNGDNADEIFALTIDTNGTSPKRVKDPQCMVAPRVEPPKTNVVRVNRGASATQAAHNVLLNSTPVDLPSSEELKSQAAAPAFASYEVNKEPEQPLEVRLAQVIRQKVSSDELDLTALIENIIRVKGFATKIRPESNARNTTLIASSTKNSAVKVSVQIQNYDKPLSTHSLEFLGQMMKFYSTGHAVLVSLSGFEPSVLNKVSQSDAKVKLWSSTDIANEVIACYSQLDDNIRASLPRI